jgi:hypothetical protein
MIEAEHHRNLARGRVGCTPRMELTPGRYPRYDLDGMYPSFVGLSRVVRARHRQIMCRTEHLGFGRLGFNKSNTCTRAGRVISLFAMLIAHEWRSDPHRSGGISPGILRRSHVPSPHRPLAAYRAEIRMHNSQLHMRSVQSGSLVLWPARFAGRARLRIPVLSALVGCISLRRESRVVCKKSQTPINLFHTIFTHQTWVPRRGILEGERPMASLKLMCSVCCVQFSCIARS